MSELKSYLKGAEKTEIQNFWPQIKYSKRISEYKLDKTGKVQKSQTIARKNLSRAKNTVFVQTLLFQFNFLLTRETRKVNSQPKRHFK